MLRRCGGAPGRFAPSSVVRSAPLRGARGWTRIAWRAIPRGTVPALILPPWFYSPVRASVRAFVRCGSDCRRDRRWRTPSSPTARLRGHPYAGFLDGPTGQDRNRDVVLVHSAPRPIESIKSELSASASNATIRGSARRNSSTMACVPAFPTSSHTTFGGAPSTKQLYTLEPESRRSRAVANA